MDNGICSIKSRVFPSPFISSVISPDFRKVNVEWRPGLGFPKSCT